MYDRAFAVFMPMRIYKNLISLPLNTIILMLIFNLDAVKGIIKKYQM